MPAFIQPVQFVNLPVSPNLFAPVCAKNTLPEGAKFGLQVIQAHPLTQQTILDVPGVFKFREPEFIQTGDVKLPAADIGQTIEITYIGSEKPSPVNIDGYSILQGVEVYFADDGRKEETDPLEPEIVEILRTSDAHFVFRRLIDMSEGRPAGWLNKRLNQLLELDDEALRRRATTLMERLTNDLLIHGDDDDRETAAGFQKILREHGLYHGPN